jgi:4-hydroxyphenylacetate 3-monooxygenase
VLATLAPFSDELAVYPSGPMLDAAPEHALSFSIPTDTPGLKFICRDSVSVNTNRFDHPLSSRFDEQDAFVIFDDVEVPRDRVFIDANLAVYNSVMKTTWWPNHMQQTMIRAQTKLEFAWGLASRMAETINTIGQPQVQQMLGEIAMFAEFARTAVFAAEQAAREYGNGMWACDARPLLTLRAALPTWFPRTNEIIRQLGSHNLLTTPARAALADEMLRPLLDKYLKGVGADAEQRSRLFRLAWDFAATALGSRNEQYERFYLGSLSRALSWLQISGDRTRANRLLDRFLTEELDADPNALQPALIQAAQ